MVLYGSYHGSMTKDEIEKRLIQAFPGSIVEVTDLTGGEDHWQVSIVSAHFGGMKRIEQQRNVMQLFDKELKSGDVHALTIRTRTE